MTRGSALCASRIVVHAESRAVADSLLCVGLVGGRRQAPIARRRRQARRPRGGARAAARQAPTSTSREADGTTALHCAVQADDARAGDDARARRRQRQGRQPLRHPADHAGGDQRQRQGARARCSRPAPIRTRGAPTGEPVLMTAARTGNAEAVQAARRPRRRRERARAVVRRDRADVGGGREPRRRRCGRWSRPAPTSTRARPSSRRRCWSSRAAAARTRRSRAVAGRR